MHIQVSSTSPPFPQSRICPYHRNITIAAYNISVRSTRSLRPHTNGMSLQFQFDVISAGSLSYALLCRFVRACLRDDIQPLAISSLESFGQWISADSKRIRQGEAALDPASASNMLQFSRIFIGTRSDGVMGLVKNSVHLTAAFLFVAGCEILGAHKTAELMYEMMKLHGNVTRDGTTITQITRFVEISRGYKDYITGPTPSQIHTQIAEAFATQPSPGWRNVPGLNDELSTPKLAERLYSVLEAMADNDLQHISLEGFKGGIFLATLMVWLRPNEVVVLASDQFTIYPPMPPLDPETQHVDRLSVVIDPTNSDGLRSPWSLKKWTTVSGGGLAVTVVDFQSPLEKSKQLCSPLSSAIWLIDTQLRSCEATTAIGYLASALVTVAAEVGHVGNSDQSAMKSVPLLDICSDQFLNRYTQVMSSFGWLDLDPGRQNAMTAALEKLGNFADDQQHGNNDIDFLGNAIFHALKDYNPENGDLFTLSRGLSDDFRDIIEYSIHVAAEALALSLCEEVPKSARYRPIEKNVLRTNARLLRGFLIGPSTDYWQLRKHTFQFLLPAGDSVSPVDLAVADQGYVAFSTLLEGQSSAMAQRRKAGTLSLRPGLLSLQGEDGRPIDGQFQKVTEHEPAGILAGRPGFGTQNPIQLFKPDGEFTSVDESLARSGTKYSVEHLVESSQLDGVLRLATFIKVPPSPISPFQIDTRVPTCWRRSIGNIIFATHVDSDNSRPRQREALAKNWWSNSRFRDRLQWCPVGEGVENSMRYITRTAGDYFLQFFESGSIAADTSPECHFFIRHEPVSLMHCLKEAMEVCANDEPWVIIS